MLSQLEAVVLAELEERGKSPQSCFFGTRACRSHISPAIYEHHCHCSRGGSGVIKGPMWAGPYIGFQWRQQESKKKAPASASLCAL